MPDDEDLVLHRVKVPPQTGTFTGRRFLLRVKTGGDMELLNVIACSEPYQAPYGKGRLAWYINVYGYGYSGRAMFSKLRYVARCSSNNDTPLSTTAQEEISQWPTDTSLQQQ